MADRMRGGYWFKRNFLKLAPINTKGTILLGVVVFGDIGMSVLDKAYRFWPALAQLDGARAPIAVCLTVAGVLVMLLKTDFS